MIFRNRLSLFLIARSRGGVWRPRRRTLSCGPGEHSNKAGSRRAVRFALISDRSGAEEGPRGVCLLMQLVNERLGRDEIGSPEPFAEPLIDRDELGKCFGCPALTALQPSKAHCGAQLP